MSNPFPKRLLDALARKQSSIHGLVAHAGSVPERPAEQFAELLVSDPRFAQDTIIELEAREDALVTVRARKAGAAVEIAPSAPVDVDLRQLFATLQGPAVVVLDGVPRLPIDVQLEWLGRFRGLHASRDGTRLVVTGAWATNAFVAAWKVRRHYLSHALNGGNVCVLGGHSHESVRELLAPFLKGPASARHALCELAFEHTQGDRHLVEHLIEDLESLADASLVEVERVILRLAEHSHVSDRILASLDVLEAYPRARQKLAACLRAGAIRLDHADPDAEQLMLHGLIRNVRRAERTHWQIASHVVMCALRKYSDRLGLARRDLGADNEILPTCNPIGAHANRLVAEIESMLRNFIIMRLAAANPEHSLLAVPRGKERDIYGDACRRLDADRNSSHVFLVAQPLSAHLEVDDLREIIAHKDLHARYFAPAYSELTLFAANFAEFNKHRQAVAHNKLASVAILPKLERLRDYFEGEIARVAESALNHEPPDSLVKVHDESLRAKVTLQGECIIEVDLENVAGVALHDVIAIARFTTDEDASLREARSLPQSVHANERRLVKLVGKGARGNPAVTEVRVASARRR